MSRRALGFAAGLLAVALSTRLPAARRIDARLRLETGPGGHSFVVEGTAELPPGTALQARLYAVETGPDLREDEEPLEEEALTFYPAAGRFRFEAGRSLRRPYSLRYRVRLAALPEGEEEVSTNAEFRLGTGEDYAAECRTRLLEAMEEIESLEGLWREVRGEIVRQEGTPDAEAWRARVAFWSPRLGGIDARNRERFGLWCVWPERQAKMGLDAAVGTIRRILDDPPGRRRERMEFLSSHFDEIRDRMGLEGRLDPEVFGPELARYERALRDWLRTPGPRSRQEVLEALLRCGPALARRPRSYAALNDLGFSLARLLEAPGPGTRAEHDRALAAFRSLAGLE